MMVRENIQLENEKLRMALKSGDNSFIHRTVILFFDNDYLSAQKLLNWFSSVTKLCSSRNSSIKQLPEQLIHYRLWQLGRIDIQGISKLGIPLYSLTPKGSHLIRNTPVNGFFDVLMFDSHSCRLNQQNDAA